MQLSSVQVGAGLAVSVVTVIGVALFARTVNLLIRVIRLGRPDPTRSGQHLARAYSLAVESLGHARLGTWRLVGVMHWFVFVGFGALFLTLITAYGQVFDPHFALPLVGRWPPYEWASEIIAWLTALGIGTLIVIRQRNHPRRPRSGPDGRRSRFFGSTFWQAYYVEATILVVALCVLTLRGLESALAPQSPSWAHFPTTAWIGTLLDAVPGVALKNAIVVVATVKIFVSMGWFIVVALQPTMGVAWHRFMAFPNIWFKRHPGISADRGLRPSLGELQPIRVNGKALDFDNLDDLTNDTDDTALGVGKVEDFSWKGLLDFNSCTECGRCQSQCPAWHTDKPLSPKLVIMNLREHAHAKAPWLLAGEAEREELPAGAKEQAERALVGEGDVLGGLASGVIDPAALWSCTTCGACVEECPVDIEHVDHIVDMRRHQVLIESAFPKELGGLFKNLEKNANPWGMSPALRMEWAKDLPFAVPVVGRDVEDLSGVEYLFWVGCAGAYEDRQKKTTRAVAELLHISGVSFAVLGGGETCTGDPARRAGNEFLFATLAAGNVETLQAAKAKKIVATCAHCFNTIKNEYPQLGGHYEVMHHTQLLNRLVRERRLVPIAPVSGTVAPVATVATVTYHDPCYLGRHNGVYSPPRELIAALPGVRLTDMPRNSERSFCCGAGGARMWMEEDLGTRINLNRTDEAVATGADTIAVGCPFCRVMLSDGLATRQAERTASPEVEVLDVAQMLLAAVKRA